MSHGLLLIDGNNIAHIANNMQPLSIGDQPTQAIYGFLRALRPMISNFSMLTPIVLWDGASWRKKVFEDYKKSREKEPTTKNELKVSELRLQMMKQRPFIREALGFLAVRQMVAANYEADDLAAVLVKKTRTEGRKVMLITGDKDWVQLIGPGVGWLDPVRNERLTAGSLPEKLGWHPGKKLIALCDGKNVDGFLGVPSPAAFLDMKCLMGDTSDDVPGVGGIGEKGAIEFVREFGSVVDFMNKCIDKTIDYTKLPKKFRQLSEDMERQDNYWRNKMLMDLNYDKRPKMEGLKIETGEFDPVAFHDFCERFQFNSMLSKVAKWVEPFAPAMEMAA